METLAVMHVFKNGGTTLIERYKHNLGFVYQRVPGEIVYNYQGPNHKVCPVEFLDAKHTNIIFGHGVNFELDKLLPHNRIKYVTILRDPVQRLLSAYNYYKLEMFNILGYVTRIDFNTWFFNKSRLLPTPTYWQYQHFSSNEDLFLDFGQQVNTKREKQLYNQAIKTINHCSHVFFLEDNYIEKFDKLAKLYNCTPIETVVHSHNTRKQLEDIVNTPYTCYEDLSDRSKELIQKYAKTEIDFYEYCKGKFN
jgi:hypothetical protein